MATVSASTARNERLMSVDHLQRLHDRADEVLTELTQSSERYQRAWASRQSRAMKESITVASAPSPSASSSPSYGVVDEEMMASHGALAFAASQAQQVTRLLDRVLRAPVQSDASSAAHSRLLVELSQKQVELKRALPRAFLALEKYGRAGDADNSAADAAAAMRSLVHTRSLLSLEVQKVDAVVQGLAGSSESVDLLQRTLQDVSTTVEVAQEVLRQLLVVKSKEDVVLRVSAVLFAVVVLYVIAQRVLGFFPVTRYVRM